jgi:hypothetical protein
MPGQRRIVSGPTSGISSTAWRPRKGRSAHLIAIAHSLLVVAYMLRKRGCAYQDLGSDYFEKINQDQLTHYHIKKTAATRVHRHGGP